MMRGPVPQPWYTSGVSSDETIHEKALASFGRDSNVHCKVSSQHSACVPHVLLLAMFVECYAGGGRTS